MSFSPNNVSNNILKRSFAERVPVTPARLQRILYLTACAYGSRTGRPLLYEPFEVWANGPVSRTVYDKFHCFGAKEIARYAKNAGGEALAVDENRYPEVKTALDQTWSRTRLLSSSQLSGVVQADGSAWAAAQAESRELLTNDEVLHDLSLRHLEVLDEFSPRSSTA